ncbi:MAG: single-stranded-DNA-specific exonuclease [Candidatus Woesebacteria bacterium GW2011_GWA2_40_7]|uniref:Single-stranded-DNA-specific exonuclease RecJ n=1 Tax=Candidatus Woesebacteria bacterium GW2011_GWA2_40_7 TaxID=1618562 RepID=A0A0G0T4M7_9BACT|nr:MAG: single-stranded-DNA-specific exonuclease [Candidatus Woesebacteria bacterium GW2011_GWA2_40_7]
MISKKWEILHKDPKDIKTIKDITNILLKNRGIKTEKQKMEFFEPIDPMKISLKSLGISESEVKKAIGRIKKAKKNDEHVIVYGDYDADGITGTATMWETLHALGIFVLPHIPERFSEGYGLNLESVARLKKEDPKLKLIITVDHGITAGKKVDEVGKMGIDMIISDHHQQGKEKTKEKLQLAAIGTVADQLPLVGPNRSIVKYGLEELKNTKRPGLLALFDEAGLTGSDPVKRVGTYEVGFMIAPRINSMGRLKHGLESLRLLCTKDKFKAMEIAGNIGRTNFDRQKMVDQIMATTLSEMKIESKGFTNEIIIIAGESYHEGVIGLAAAKLVEEFYRPAIVLSIKEGVAKASARSISGFNIIEAIRKFEDLYIEGGGHPMAAGFSIKTENIPEFSRRLNKLAKGTLTEELLQRRLKIDLELDFEKINPELVEWVKKFEPSGLGNPSPVFVSKDVEIISVKAVGRDAKHLKLKLRQNEHIFDSIFFGGGEMYSKLSTKAKLDVVYRLEENVWNGLVSLQLQIRDIKVDLH